MFLIHGKREVKIKEFFYSQSCPDCRSFELFVTVYKKYFHVFYIPLFPLRGKTVDIRCHKCDDVAILPEAEKEIAQSIKNPLYMYSGLMIIGVLVIASVIISGFATKERAQFIASPKVADVYKIRNHESKPVSWYFLRVSRVNGDSVFVLPSRLAYTKFMASFSDDNYFMKDEETVYTKKQLKEMLNNDEIATVERNYSSSSGFNRVH